MSPKVRALVGRIARGSRTVAGAAWLALGIRVAWLGGAAALAQFSQEPTARARTPLGTDPQSQGLDGDEQRRRQLQELARLGKDVTNAPSGQAQTPESRLRHIVVDLGPSRSDVFINGRSVGKTPYAGQWRCASGEVLEIQVLPGQGAPLNAGAVCRGDHLKAKPRADLLVIPTTDSPP